MSVLIKASKLCKKYSSGEKGNTVLSDVDVEIYDGDFTVIMGCSGSGKSTLLYCLSGMDDITSGSVMYKNEDISKYSEKKLVHLRCGEFGFVFQQIHMVSNLSLYENIAVPGYVNQKLSVPEIKKRADNLIKQFGIEKIKDHLPKQSSGGEQQRAAIARALIHEPRLLFADEPTGALNKKSGTEVLEILNKINENGQSILMVTHDIKAAVRANRILYISDGKIIDEMSLKPYKPNDAKAREEKITAWLTSLSW